MKAEIAFYTYAATYAGNSNSGIPGILTMISSGTPIEQPTQGAPTQAQTVGGKRKWVDSSPCSTKASKTGTSGEGSTSATSTKTELAIVLPLLDKTLKSLVESHTNHKFSLNTVQRMGEQIVSHFHYFEL